LAPTTARWYNKRRRRHNDHDGWTERWAKVLAHRGSYEQFAYGTDTPSTWNGRFQVCQICSIWSGAIGVDVDGPAFASTRTARLITPELAFTRRAEHHWHALIDARCVPEQDWPIQGPICGGDIKSAGFIPVPNCWHYSGDLYELAHSPAVIVPATPELMAAIAADRADENTRARAEGRYVSGGGGEYDGRGHDSAIAGTVFGNILRGLTKAECYGQWLKVAVPADPSWPYEEEDFNRHYGDERHGALAKAIARRTAEAASMPEIMAWGERVNRQARDRTQFERWARRGARS